MTFLGKILVVLNMIMGIFFMAFAMIVYTTRVDLRQTIAHHEKTIQTHEANLKKNADLIQAEEKKVKDLTEAKQKDAEGYEQRIKELTDKTKQLAKDMAEFRERHTKDEAVTLTATENQTIRNAEIDTNRKYLEEAQQRESALIRQNSELKDKLLQTTNDLNLTLKRGEEMAERVAELERYINLVAAQYDVPPLEQLAPDAQSQAPPPNIEGVVTKVDPDGKHILISLGSDDGLKKGHMLEMWRTKPEPVYIGKIKVETVDHTTAVVKVVQLSGRTLPQANDRVGPNIMPYRAN